jgi:hypothetical protein
MRRSIALLGLVASLAACGSEPRIVSSDAFQVSIAFDGSESGLRKANELARERCRQGGRAPVRTSVVQVAEGPVAYYNCRLGG